MTCLRAPFLALSTVLVLTPAAASARREPGPAEAPAAAQPVAPAAPPAETTPIVVNQTPTPVVVAPAPAPVVTPAMQPAPPLPPSPPPKNKVGNGYIAGGASLFAVAYLYTSVLGAIAIDKGRKGHTDPTTGQSVHDDERIAFGRRLMVPVVGPFMAIGHTDSALRKWGSAMSGLAQVGGVAMLVTGVVLKRRAARERRFGITASASGNGGGILVHGRF